MDELQDLKDKQKLSEAVLVAQQLLLTAEQKAKSQLALQAVGDHDLLLTVHAEVKSLRVDVQKLTISSDKQAGDYETRLRLLESFKSVLMGGFILSNTIIVPILIWLVIKALTH